MSATNRHASTAALALALATAAAPASAQGIALFGDARLGLGYNIRNNGFLATDEPDVLEDGNTPVADQKGTEKLRAISRVRFGVNMTGETDSGISFGAIIRADHGRNGGANTEGQRAGLVFVSGDFGTLSYGDVNGADQFNVGAPRAVGLTDLGELELPPYFSNGGGRAGDETGVFLNLNALPTVRYDYEIAGFGVSVSTNRDLNDLVVGGSYQWDFDQGDVSVGLGYADISAFLSDGGVAFPDIDQFSAGVSGNYGGLSGALVYTNADAGGSNVDEFETVAGGLGYEFGPWLTNGFFQSIINATGPQTFELLDGETAYGVGATYDLGGGAVVRGGYVRDYGANNRADFGIAMSF